MTAHDVALAVSLLVGFAAALSRQIGCLVQTVLVAFVSALAMVAAWALVLAQVGRDNAAVVREKVVTVVDA